MIASDPRQGGATWAVLQYLLGFRELGHEVFLVEPISVKSVRPSQSRLEDSEHSAYLREVPAKFDLNQNSALLKTNEQHTVGVAYKSIQQFARSADLLLNISGMLTDEELTAPIPVRI